jgi:hypothetical protein
MYLQQLPPEVRQAVTTFLARVPALGGVLRWDGYPRVEIRTPKGSLRMLVSLEWRTWYLQVRPIQGLSHHPAERASDSISYLSHARVGQTYHSFAWPRADAVETEDFLAIALDYVRDVAQAPQSAI